MQHEQERTPASLGTAAVKGKKMLLLGGMDIQVPAIEKARAMGVHVITAGNRPTDIGHTLANESHLVSSTDLEGVLRLSERLGIDGISAYGSDPAAVTAAYVSDALGLPGNGHEAVQRLQDKVLFREAQHALGIAAPRSQMVRDAEQVLALASAWRHGGILKPVDTSGSKGVFRVGANDDPATVQGWIDEALAFSRLKKLVIEEFLVRTWPQMTGDVLIIDGRIPFFCMGDVHFNDRINGLVPRSVTIPATVPMHLQQQAVDDVERLVQDLGIRTGVFNIDVVVDDQDRAIVIDIGARNGGNMLSELMHRRTGMDLTESSILQSLGVPVELPPLPAPSGHFAHMVLHAEHDGLLRSIEFSSELEQYIFHRTISARPGDRVQRFTSSAGRLGLLLVSFPDQATAWDIIGRMHEHVRVVIDQA